MPAQDIQWLEGGTVAVVRSSLGMQQLKYSLCSVQSTSSFHLELSMVLQSLNLGSLKPDIIVENIAK